MKHIRLELTGYPVLRERLRMEFRMHRSRIRVCTGCQMPLCHIDTNWLAVRGSEVADYAVCTLCSDETEKDLKERLHSEINGVVWLIVIEGSELFI